MEPILKTVAIIILVVYAMVSIIFLFSPLLLIILEEIVGKFRKEK